LVREISQQLTHTFCHEAVQAGCRLIQHDHRWIRN
jgi:hypothetical protein